MNASNTPNKANTANTAIPEHPGPFEGGPPILTDCIEAQLDAVEHNTSAKPKHQPHMEALSALLPELFEKALLRVKPQLMQEFETLLNEAVSQLKR